ncbi:copper-translocating P-type ATPase [Colletotrichum orchidophilum]|uniref:Copper-translocating P-type ATPase n=1 Tax=Colletotrichum orchidophilum TaxID=1209926 RepID=A0A1G4BR55_9PEZI|nr:copper-translocating P-type ATPase [Colletotrichum orchidophilum]OHF03843.1 copper-translocating P-type ATPase [Colletotrichum orchidophilum]
MACRSGCCGPPHDQAIAHDAAPPIAPGESTGDVPSGGDTCCEESGLDIGSDAEMAECNNADDGRDENCNNTHHGTLVGDAVHQQKQGCAASKHGSIDSEQPEEDCCAPKTNSDGCVNACCESRDGQAAVRSAQHNAVHESANDSAKRPPGVECQLEGDLSDPQSFPASSNGPEPEQECCAPKPRGCSLGCCGSIKGKESIDTPKTISTKAIANRTAVKSHSDADEGPKICSDDSSKGCCSSSPAPDVHEEEALRCCEGKKAPCCDSTCIDRLALRECVSGMASKSLHSRKASAENNCAGGRDGKPCSGHSKSVREVYQSKLDALGCICRALLALGQESCCAPRDRSSIDRKRSSKKSTSLHRASVESCCTSAMDKTASSPAERKCGQKFIRTSRTGTKPSAYADGCCSKPRPLSIAESCADCCDDESPPSVDHPPLSHVSKGVSEDVEQRLTEKEHVILSISGMTCTGCETKLRRTLARMDAVKDLKTSLVLARAEFDLDVGAVSVDQVVKHLERTTEFKCEKVSWQGASIDILCPSEPQDFINLPWPNGVIDIRVMDKTSVHVEFDANIVGARDLVEKGWGAPVTLAPLRADPSLEAGSKHVRNMGFITLLSTILTIPVLVMAWAPLSEREIVFGSASLALATIVQVAIAGPFYLKALKSLIFSRVIEMDLLIVLSTSAAYIFSVVSFGFLVSQKPLSTGEFFETSTLLVTLIMVGRYVSALARQKAIESISIRSLQMSTVLIVYPSGEDKEIDARLLQYGDIFKVVPDSRIPTDGTITSGSSEVDESMITGESASIEKFIGSSVIAGTINGSGTLTVRLSRLPGNNTISNIARMVDEAKLSKPKTQEIADRVASYFVPVVVAITIITFSTWIAIGITVRKQTGSEATIQAVTYAITVLIVSCPCAIGLAVPMVILIASGVAADKGVIFKSADSIELAYKTSHVVFDKTGNITNGKLTVVHEAYLTNDREAMRSLLLGLVGTIKHPVSTAIFTHLKANGVAPTTVMDLKTLTGRGVEAKVDGIALRAGNSRWLGLSTDPRVQPVLSESWTAFCFTVNDSLVAVFGLEDSIRADALETISSLQASGITVHLLSGDDDGAVQTVASRVGIPDINVRSRCTPGDKQEYIQQLLSQPLSDGIQARPKNPKEPVVIFCGDGTNDAVALAQATIGVQMSEGTDVAKSAADVVLMRPGLAGILTVIAISKKAIHRITFNFGWSFVYNLVAILLGAGAFVNARIPPEFAGLGELVSVLPVIAAAVLLRWNAI